MAINKQEFKAELARIDVALMLRKKYTLDEVFRIAAENRWLVHSSRDLNDFSEMLRYVYCEAYFDELKREVATIDAKLAATRNEPKLCWGFR